MSTTHLMATLRNASALCGKRRPTKRDHVSWGAASRLPADVCAKCLTQMMGDLGRLADAPKMLFMARAGLLGFKKEGR